MESLATNALILNPKFVKIISELVAKNKGSTANCHKTHQRLEFSQSLRYSVYRLDRFIQIFIEKR